MPVMRIMDFGVAEEAARLERGAEVALETKSVMLEIAVDMFRVMEAVFSSNGRRGGGSWARLKDETIRKKGNNQLLRTTGSNAGYSALGNDALFKSVTQPGAEYNILEIGNSNVVFGTESPDAEFQQEGTYKSPARPFLKFTLRDINRWMDLVSEHLLRPFVV